MNEKVIAVVTTVQEPTESLTKLNSKVALEASGLIVVGDRKGPVSLEMGNNVCFLPIDEQVRLGFSLAKQLPENHYARKNLGYLEAIKQGATLIYETDDDNAPLDSWQARQLTVNAVQVKQNGWYNAYRWFTEELIWPRGLPLDEILSPCLPLKCEKTKVMSPIQQGLANNSPDVDAIWRLVMDREITFDSNDSILLPPGTWCPFNSQSTWWWPEAYMLMYLPSYCSFRMTDIWRSFIAQRCLWESGAGVVFHGPEVYQDRNLHDLMKDFSQEVVGYEGNRRMADLLEGLSLSAGAASAADNLRTCYESLVRAQFFPAEELVLVDSWITDVESLRS